MTLFRASLLDILICSKEGLIEKLLRIEPHSLLRQFDEWVHLNFQTNNKQIKDVTATWRTYSPGQSAKVDAAAAINTYGILVGTSDQAVAISDYNLIAKIAHGSGAGQLYHNAVTINDPVLVGTTEYFTITRAFNNISGTTVTVKEIGLIAQTGSYFTLLERTTPGDIEVLNTKTLMCQYTFQCSL